MNKINHFIKEHTVLSSILLYFVEYLFVGSLIISFTPSKYQIYTRLIISLFLFFFMIRISRKEFDNIIEQINEVLGTGALITAVTTFIIFVINIALTFLSVVIFKQTTVNNNIISFLFSQHPYIMGLITILLLPFIEELLFKSQIFKNTKFLKKHKVIKTIIVALLFASFHCITEITALNYKVIFSLINYFIFYVITNTIYIKSNYNIMKPIAIHMLLNTLSLIITL